jgi:TIR domain
MLIFVSYARRDHPAVRSLAERLRLLHHDVWLDDELSGGQVWWDRILASIRDCDTMLLAVSSAVLESEACALERQYAAALGKPVLPVMVESVPPDLLPPDLAVVQFVDYTTRGEEAAFRLIGALSTLPSATPLPDPLPEPPPVPISYLSDISRRVHAPSLTLDEQLALVARLKLALRRAADRQATLGLLAKLRQREDLYYAAARELEQLDAEPEPAPAEVGEPAAPGGEPSGRGPSIVPFQSGEADRGQAAATADQGHADRGQAAGTAPQGGQPAGGGERRQRQPNLAKLNGVIGKFENGLYEGQKKALREMVTADERLLALCRCGFAEDTFRYVALLLTSDQLIWCRQLFSVRKGSMRWDEVQTVGPASAGFSVTTHGGTTLTFTALSETGIWFDPDRPKFGPAPVKQLVEELVASRSGQPGPPHGAPTQTP